MNDTTKTEVGRPIYRPGVSALPASIAHEQDTRTIEAELRRENKAIVATLHGLDLEPDEDGLPGADFWKTYPPGNNAAGRTHRQMLARLERRQAYVSELEARRASEAKKARDKVAAKRNKAKALCENAAETQRRFERMASLQQEALAVLEPHLRAIRLLERSSEAAKRYDDWRRKVIAAASEYGFEVNATLAEPSDFDLLDSAEINQVLNTLTKPQATIRDAYFGPDASGKWRDDRATGRMYGIDQIGPREIDPPEGEADA